MLGGHAGVTDNTVLQYLGIVEQRTNELLQLQAFIQAKVAKQNIKCSCHKSIYFPCFFFFFFFRNQMTMKL